jgi:dTDP-4-amino-4,6-dideoxygalactose transaminase
MVLVPLRKDTVNIPFNRFEFTRRETGEALKALKSGHIAGGGPRGKAAEQLLSEIHCGADVLLTTSCTHALEMTALLLNLEQGDEVIVPAFTFVSSALAFLAHGARPVFVDVREDTLNIDESLIEAAITNRTRAICVVNYAGLGADLPLITAIAKKHNLVVIEDNAHGLGGTIQGQTLGTFGSMSTLSFHETKNVSCGEGGALVLNDPGLKERAEILRDKGTNRSNFFRGQVDKYTWVDKGSSWVLSDLLAAFLPPQLENLGANQQHRTRLWNAYWFGLQDWAREKGFTLPVRPEGASQTSHLFHVRTNTLDQRSRLISSLAEAGISSVFHYQALHLSPMAQRLGYTAGQFPVSERASDTLLRLPLFRTLKERSVAKIVGQIVAKSPVV